MADMHAPSSDAQALAGQLRELGAYIQELAEMTKSSGRTETIKEATQALIASTETLIRARKEDRSLIDSLTTNVNALTKTVDTFVRRRNGGRRKE